RSRIGDRATADWCTDGVRAARSLRVLPRRNRRVDGDRRGNRPCATLARASRAASASRPMTNLPPAVAHLTEDERQGAADGSLPPADRARVAAHLDACPDCAADVGRLTALMTRINDSRSTPPAPPPGDLWPDIRRQIERTKVVALESSAKPVAR